MEGCQIYVRHRVQGYIGVILGSWKIKLEATIVYWGYTGIVDSEMETTIMGLYRVKGLGFRQIRAPKERT